MTVALVPTQIVRRLMTIFSVLVVQTLHAQSCDELFKQVTEKVKRDRQTATLQGFDIACHIRVKMEDGAVHTEDLEVTMQGKKYKYSSKSMSLYQDEKTSVVISNSDNTILLTRPTTINQWNQYEQFAKIQDSLASYFVIKSCEKEWGTVDKNTGYYKMTLLPKAKLKGMGVNAIIYSVAVDKMEVRKINIFYGPELGDGIKEYEMVITRMNNAPKQIPFVGSALDKVMIAGKLRSDYSSYSVLDKRN